MKIGNGIYAGLLSSFLFYSCTNTVYVTRTYEKICSKVHDKASEAQYGTNTSNFKGHLTTFITPLPKDSLHNIKQKKKLDLEDYAEFIKIQVVDKVVKDSVNVNSYYDIDLKATWSLTYASKRSSKLKNRKIIDMELTSIIKSDYPDDVKDTTSVLDVLKKPFESKYTYKNKKVKSITPYYVRLPRK
jgi:hypothetical protein